MSLNHRILPPNEANTLLSAVMNQFPSSQERRGDTELDRARALTIEFESVIPENDRRVIEERTT
jgi:hypothetical protein